MLTDVLSSWICCTILGLTPKSLRAHPLDTLFAIGIDWSPAAGLGSSTPEGPVTSARV